MRLANVVLYVFKHLQSDLSTVSMWHVEVFASFTEEAAPFSIFSRINAIQGHPDYDTSATEPISLNLQNNIVTSQWHVMG